MANPAISLAIFYFFYFALVGVYIIYFQSLLLEHGYSKLEVGIIYAAAPFMRFLLPFVFKNYIHLTHRVYKISLVMTLVSSLLFFITIDNFWYYLMANLFFGGSMGVALPFVEIIALQTVTKSLYGRVRLWGSIGFIVAALWLGSALEDVYQVLEYLSVAAFATMLAGYHLVRFDCEREQTGNLQELNGDFSLSKYWAFWTSAFLLQVSFGGFYNFFTVYEITHGISQVNTGYLWTFGVICEIVLFYFQAPLLHFDLLALLKITILSAVLRWFMLFLFPGSLIVAYASQALHAFSFALYYTVVISYVYTLYRQKKLAQQFLLGLTFGLGGSAGAMIAGWIYQNESNYLFAFECVIAIGSLLFIFLHEFRKESIADAR